MPLPKDSYYPDIQQNIVQNWRDFISNCHWRQGRNLCMAVDRRPMYGGRRDG